MFSTLDDTAIVAQLIMPAVGKYGQTEALINFHIDPETGEVVVHRIGRRFVLRRGDLVGCIENRQFTGGGKRTTTGTVNQDVIRETKQAEEAKL